MAGQTSQTAPAAGLRGFEHFCRSCKSNITGKKVLVVSEWCCACLLKLARDHTHLCEYDFAAAKKQCNHCRGNNYANTMNPCVGPPSDARDAAADLLEKAECLCHAEYKVAKLRSKSALAWMKKPEYEAKLVGWEAKYATAKHVFDEAAARFQKLNATKYTGPKVPPMSDTRRDEDKAKGLTKNDIFKKTPAAVQSINMARVQAGVQPGMAPDSAKMFVEAIAKAETAMDQAMAYVFSGSIAGVAMNDDLEEKFRKRVQELQQRVDAFPAFVNTLNTLRQQHVRFDNATDGSIAHNQPDIMGNLFGVPYDHMASPSNMPSRGYGGDMSGNQANMLSQSSNVAMLHDQANIRYYAYGAVPGDQSSIQYRIDGNGDMPHDQFNIQHHSDGTALHSPTNMPNPMGINNRFAENGMMDSGHGTNAMTSQAQEQKATEDQDEHMFEA